MTPGGRIGLAAAVAAALLAWWALRPPGSPEALFRARCSACHELQVAKLCALSPARRAGVVATMRSVHGADEVIDEREARIIARYLKEGLSCP